MRDSKFIEIDYDNWDRKDIYEEYKEIVYFVTVDIDVTNFVSKYKGYIKVYPFMTYCVSRIVNEHKEYRMAIKDGKIGYYEEAHPLYTLLRKNKLFTHKSTIYDKDFAVFYKRFLKDKEIGEASDKLYADGVRPHNSISISTMPHVSFKNISFMYDTKDINQFIPFSTFGKFYERDGRWYCPVVTEFFHGVNDGYHAEIFNNELQRLVDEFEIDLDELK